MQKRKNCKIHHHRHHIAIIISIILFNISIVIMVIIIVFIIVIILLHMPPHGDGLNRCGGGIMGNVGIALKLHTATFAQH